MLDAQRRQHARQDGGGGALDVVVEGQDLLLVDVQQAERVFRRKIFKLDERLRPAPDKPDVGFNFELCERS